MVFAFKILIIVGFLSACHGYNWISGAPTNGSYYYACLGDSMTFPWAITTSSSERAQLEFYFKDSDGNLEVIATYANGEFLVSHSSRRRLTFAGNFGLTISNLTHEDFGEYSVRLDINNVIIETRYAILQRSEPPRTEDDLLHARMLPKAVFISDVWHVQLACGTFYTRDYLSSPVKWKTPSGHVLNSDTSSNGEYILRLTDPIEEGNYSCFIDINDPDARCAHVPASMLVSNDIHVDDCFTKSALYNSATREIEDISSAFQHLVNVVSDTVRLVSGSRPWNGRVEVKYNGTWGAVCSSSYYSNIAQVVCRMLGLRQDTSSAPQTSVGNYGTSTLPALIGYLSCTGNEASIFNCNLNYNGQSCSRYYDLGVDCLPRFTTI